MEGKIPSGSKVLDEFLEGGYEADVVTTIYGPAGSGKTTACLLAAIASEKKVIYVDTEGGFSIERLRQLAGADFEKASRKIFVLHPTTFEQQQEAIQKLKTSVDKTIGLVVIDTIAMLYRAEMGVNEDYQQVNKSLAGQMANLIRIVRDKKVPVIITNQVYADFENKDAVHLVGGDVIKYGSKCLIEFKPLAGGIRKAVLRKHRHLPAGKEACFEIRNDGFAGASADERKRPFGLF